MLSNPSITRYSDCVYSGHGAGQADVVRPPVLVVVSHSRVGGAVVRQFRVPPVHELGPGREPLLQAAQAGHVRYLDQPEHWRHPDGDGHRVLPELALEVAHHTHLQHAEPLGPIQSEFIGILSCSRILRRYKKKPFSEYGNGEKSWKHLTSFLAGIR